MDDLHGAVNGLKSKRRGKKNRETKFSLVFDEKNRTEFLTGFRKRKQERRKRGHEQMVAQHKEEKRQAKKKKREEICNRREYERGVPEVDHILEKEIDMPNHTVTVTEVEPLTLDNERLGFNRVNDGDDSESDGGSRKPVTSGRSRSKNTVQPSKTLARLIQKQSKTAGRGRHRAKRGVRGQGRPARAGGQRGATEGGVQKGRRGRDASGKATRGGRKR